MKMYFVSVSNKNKLFFRQTVIQTTNRADAAKALRECRTAGYKYINYWIGDSEHVLGSVMVFNWRKPIYHKTDWAHP